MSGPRRLLLAALGSLVLAACRYSGDDLCDDACDCIGCSESRRNGCYREADRCDESAADLGCGDFHAELLECAAKTGQCEPSPLRYRASCDPERQRLASCMGAQAGACL